MRDSLKEAQEIWDREKKEEEEYWRTFDERMDEQSRNRTPEESRQLFYELGILDENGEIVEGREALVQDLLDYARKMRENNSQ